MAAKKTKLEDDRYTLAEIFEDVNKDYPDAPVLVRGSDIALTIPRTTTGVLALDLAIGGGWPLNQWSEIIGSPSDGKTALAFKTVAANQALDPQWECLWVAAEEFVPKYAASIGVDLSRVWVLETNEMERVYNVVLKALDNRAVDCVVIDSLPALVPAEEDEKLIEEFTIGLGARINGKFFRKSSQAQRRSMLANNDDRPCLGLVINQWRDRIGVMWGDPRTTPGGKGKDFFFFVRAEVKRDDWITGASKTDKIGQVIKILAMKNKTYRPQQVAQVDFYFARHGSFRPGYFDEGKDVMFAAIGLDVIEQHGAMYTFNGHKWRGKESVLEDLRSEVGLIEEVRASVMDRFSTFDQDPVEVSAPAAAPQEKRVVRRGS